MPFKFCKVRTASSISCWALDACARAVSAADLFFANLIAALCAVEAADATVNSCWAALLATVAALAAVIACWLAVEAALAALIAAVKFLADNAWFPADVWAATVELATLALAAAVLAALAALCNNWSASETTLTAELIVVLLTSCGIAESLAALVSIEATLLFNAVPESAATLAVAAAELAADTSSAAADDCIALAAFCA